MALQLNDLSKYAQSQNPTISTRINNFSCLGLINVNYSSFEVIARSKGLCFHKTVFNDNIDAYKGDSLRILQIFNNLVDNSIKYTTQGSIHISAICKQTGIYIIIKDDGIGINPKELKHIQDPFKRGTNIPDGVAGSGLGLAIVVKILTLMNGHLSIAANHPQGTIVKVWIPLQPVNADSDRS